VSSISGEHKHEFGFDGVLVFPGDRTHTLQPAATRPAPAPDPEIPSIPGSLRVTP
jgi:hypothetical protein